MRILANTTSQTLVRNNPRESISSQRERKQDQMEREDINLKVILHQNGRWRGCVRVEEHTTKHIDMEMCGGEERTPGICLLFFLRQSLKVNSHITFLGKTSIIQQLDYRSN